VQPTSFLSVTANGEFVWNSAFKKYNYEGVALNNRAACSTAGCDQFAGGPYGFTARVGLGTPTRWHQLDWSAGVEYRYLQSDAVVDAFTDPDFGLGGTNLQGYIVTGSLGIVDQVAVSVLFSSASSIVGPRYQVDELLIDVMARF
jgi:hypothetical protein